MSTWSVNPKSVDKRIALRRELEQLIPNLAVLHVDTKFQVYKEFKPERNIVELTIFYREPDKSKIRIDAELQQRAIKDLRSEDLLPSDVRIVQWTLATEAIK